MNTTPPRWEQVADGLRRLHGNATGAQVKLGARYGIDVRMLPATVAAVRLRRALAEELLEPPRTAAPTTSQLEYLDELVQIVPGASSCVPNTTDEADALVVALHAAHAAHGLRALQPVPGDVLVYLEAGAEHHGQLSSIGDDGRLHFANGPGLRTRPYRVVKVVRTADKEYAKAAESARNQAALRNKHASKQISTRIAELGRFAVDKRAASQAEALEYSDVLDQATDEKPLQNCLQRMPAVLGRLLTSHQGAFVIPQQILGGKYVADFLVAGVTSHGIQWVLVELESPTASPYLQGGTPGKELRKGLSQIDEWREWLMNNLDMARRPVSEDGLGLVGITPQSPGLVVIGRGTPTELHDVQFSKIARESQIHVRSYDWIARHLQHAPALGHGSLGIPDPEDP